MKRILIQLDTDSHASTFDRVVAVDAGVDELFSYCGVTPDNVEPLVHGAMFTRGPQDLKNTALFVGGSNVAAGEAVLEKIGRTFFGPMRVSVMMDSNGSNTTASAAVLAAARHLTLSETDALVFGGAGPVGSRVVQLLAMQGARVRVGSRSIERSRQTCDSVARRITGARLTPCETDSDPGRRDAGRGAQLIVAAGAAGVQFLAEEDLFANESLRVAIDLNAVPPLGLGGIDVTAKAKEHGSVACYGAIGVGGTKMKIHKAAVARLFESNEHVLDTETVFAIGQELESRL